MDPVLNGFAIIKDAYTIVLHGVFDYLEAGGSILRPFIILCCFDGFVTDAHVFIHL